MCIASFQKLKDRFVFTFTRDERLDRPFQSPSWVANNVFAPIDKEAGGTWIGVNDSSILSLQNGGTFRHSRQLPYDKSRGVLLLDLLINKDWQTFYGVLAQNHIEPFTITEIDLESQSIQLHIYENEKLKLVKLEENTHFINCSSTLYDEANKSKFKVDFNAIPFENEDELMKFHLDHAIGSQRNPLTRPNSTSITQFVINDGLSCKFMDLTQTGHPQELTILNLQ